MTPALFQKYLRKNPAPPAGFSGIRCAAVVPLYNELANLPQLLVNWAEAVAAAPEPVAFITVVNFPAGSDDGESRKSWEFLLEKRQEFPFVYPIYAPGLANGVGEARKIGMDSFLHSCSDHAAAREAVICSLDGDTLIEKEYFVQVIPAIRQRGGAATVGLSHRQPEDPPLAEAIKRYENHQREYVKLLRQAGSSYAFFAVGSAFAVRGDACVRCGGMRKRKAGEDFYFLQAVEKCDHVFSIEKVLVHPSPRISKRVPFGTGPAMESLLNGGKLAPWQPEAFAALREILTRASDDELLRTPEKFTAALPEKIREFFTAENFDDAWKKVLQNLPDDPVLRQKSFKNWFDGLKQLRFIHFFSKYYSRWS